MRLHLVGGFLGSGKTTAIGAAARRLLDGGSRVGVVTNDQGQYLVDTLFFQQANIPAVEVTGGCFCCNYEDLETRLSQLQAAAQPEVVFAESVGSCADMVATVVKPLLRLRHTAAELTSFSVFVDARLLRLWLRDEELPFSDSVVYIFGKQIEEAGLLVINKIDLLPDAALQETEALFRARFPGKAYRLQNSRQAGQVERWLEQIETGAARLPSDSLQIDYNRYGDGEAQLAWLDERVTVQFPQGQGRAVLLEWIETILAELERRRWSTGHLKLLLQSADGPVKLSITALGDPDWRAQLPAQLEDRQEILLNARVETSATDLRQIVNDALEKLRAAGRVEYTTAAIDSFHPGFPHPQYRLE